MRKSPGENAGTRVKAFGVQSPDGLVRRGLIVKARFAPALFGHEATLGAKRDGQDALVLGCVGASRT